MSVPLLLSNLGLYSLQIGLLVGVAAVVPALVRLRAPAARLAYWHILLVACVVLPLVRPWRQEVVTAPPATEFRNQLAVHHTPPIPVHRDFPWSEAALWVLAAGAAGRMIWLAAGLLRLRRYRLHSEPLDTAYDANIRVSPDVSSPVTFGVFDPVILVPPDFVDLAEPMQRAILCHEILHIERHDWIFTMVEELVRAVFWFHPAIWWVLGQIHLAREQAVDRRVIEMTEARDPYVDALLAMAGVRPQLDLAPAPLFLRQRHLKHRVVEILKEAKMSKKRLISAMAAGVALLAATCWFVTGAIPLAAAPQMVTDGTGVSVNTNGAQLMHRSPVMYPGDAIAKGVQGTVVVQVTLDASGDVTDAAVQSGPEELRKAVIQSVLNWHFMKDAAGSTRTITVDFTAPPVSPRRPVNVTPGVTMREMNTQTRRLADIQVVGLSDQAKSDLLAQLPVHVGDNVGPDQLVPVMQAVRNFDQHLSVAFRSNASGETVLHIAAPGSQPGVLGGIIGGVPGGGAPPPPPPPQDAGATSVPGRIRVGSNVQANNLVSQTTPEYPALAKQARIQGVVELAAVIGKDGHVINLSVVKGHPLLVQAAIDAVKDWVYKPTLLNGQPVEVQTMIDVNFTLAE